MTTVFLSGPMTNEPHYREIFNFFEDLFEYVGYEVVNPVFISDYIIKEHKIKLKDVWKEEYRNLFLREDVSLMVCCDAVVMLPNWKKSKGAKLEHKIAKLMGMEIFYV